VASRSTSGINQGLTSVSEQYWALAGSGSLTTVSFTLSEASLALQADGFEAKL
jgi:hypothetical protein